MGNRNDRLEVIKQLEKALNTNILVLYFNTEDPAFGTQLAMDVLPHIRTAIKKIPDITTKSLTTFIQSNGGVLDSSWPILLSLRAASKPHNLNFLVNDKALSAATLLCLGGDKIQMSSYATLGPIDPQLNLSPAPNVRIGAGVEDIQGYYDLINNLFSKDDLARAQAFAILANRIPAETLGQVQRVRQYIRFLAEKMIRSRKIKPKPDKIKKLVKALTEDFFSHNYRISPSEAKEIGLPVVSLDKKTEDLLDQLSKMYNQSMGVGSDLTVSIQDDQESTEVDKDRAFVETINTCITFKSKVIVNKNRTAQVNDFGWQESQ